MKKLTEQEQEIRERTLRSSRKIIEEQRPFLDAISFKKGARILDIGCGPGIHMEYFANRGLTPVGLDRDKRPFLFDGVFNLIVSSSEKAEIDDESYDYIFASHVLEHCGDVYSSLCEWKRWLKPEGCMIIIVPPYSCYVANDHWSIGWNMGQLAMLLVAAGFDCFGTTFMRVGHNVCGYGVKKNIPTSGFNIHKLLSFLPKNICKTFFISDEGNEHLNGECEQRISLTLQEYDILQKEVENAKRETTNLRQERDTVLVENESLQQKNNELSNENEAKATALESLQQKNNELSNENETKATALESLQQKNNELSNENEAKAASLDMLQQKCDSLTVQINAFHSAFWWRITKPARFVSDILKSIGRFSG